jgi:high-affinity Fe2+/Pb2+ permease
MGDIPNRGPQLIAVVAVLLAFSLTATILRCYVRINLVKAFGVDDYLMVFAMVRDGANTTYYI